MQTLFCLTRKFTASRDANVAVIVRAAEGTDKKLISGVTSFDVYDGKDTDQDKKSIAIAVTIRPREKALTDLDIDAIAAQIVTEVRRKAGGRLRESPA